VDECKPLPVPRWRMDTVASASSTKRGPVRAGTTRPRLSISSPGSAWSASSRSWS